MKKFVNKAFLFALFPMLVIVALILVYMKRDVYYDFGKYRNYSWKYNFQTLGDISTKKLLQSPTAYNSFIFGSSRSTSLYACYAQTKIPGSRFFHYANWDETIGGMYEKLRLLESLHYAIDNVIIYLDTDNSFAEQGLCKPYDHYLLTHKNKYSYYYNHLSDFFSDLGSDRVKILLGQKVEGPVFPNCESDLMTNDCNHTCSDSIIRSYGNKNFDAAYYARIDSLKKSGFLYARGKEQKAYTVDQISPGEEEILNRMGEIFSRHKTRYWVIITPLYDQLKFSPADKGLLEKKFGANLFDFSGINRYTDNEYNYSDRKHFQSYISKEMADSVIRVKAN